MPGKRPRAATPSRHSEKLTSVEIMDDLEEIDMPFEEGSGDTLDPVALEGCEHLEHLRRHG